MKNTKTLGLMLLASGIVALIAACASQMGGEPSTGAAVRIDNDDIGGVVTSANGPEAGVWVIAETRDLPTRFARMVVTDDQGRYVVPDLPNGTYDLWVRGYGLVDSPKVKATPGKIENLKAVIAPNEAAAAQYYPSIYWYSMMKIPDKSEFGGKGKVPADMTQNEYLNLMKSNGCANCHAIGNRAMRTFPDNVPFPMGKFATSEEAWFRRIQSGQGGHPMFETTVKQLGSARICVILPTGRTASPRASCLTRSQRGPQGVERNIVVTTWDWLDDKHYLHDLIASDRRFPRSTPMARVRFDRVEHRCHSGPRSAKRHSAKNFPAPVRDADTPVAMRRGTDAAVALLGQRADLD